jgi:hypothetical protein
MTDEDRRTDEERPFWVLTPDDLRGLWINFLGSMTGLVTAAFVVAGGIALSRRIVPDSMTLTIGVILAVLTVLGCAAAVVAWRWTFRGAWNLQARRWRLVTATILTAASAVLLLAWIGVLGG